MNVNADFAKRVLLHSDEIEWEASPMPGVERRRLDRVHADNERVTTIVRYAPGSQFSSHVHGGGEEFIVIDGVFEDDYGDWPEGSYIRNPPQSKHTPGSKEGCTIFVKLWQFQPDDRTFVHANRHKIGTVEDRHRPGCHLSTLFHDDHETVRIETWEPSTTHSLDTTGGAELFVLEGAMKADADKLRKHSWLRVPPTSQAITVKAGIDGATVWIKTGHLAQLRS